MTKAKSKRAPYLLPMAATGKVETYIATMFEGEAIDSVTGERIMARKRESS